MALSTKINAMRLNRAGLRSAKASRPVVKANSARVDKHSKSDIVVAPSILSGVDGRVQAC